MFLLSLSSNCKHVYSISRGCWTWHGKSRGAGHHRHRAGGLLRAGVLVATADVPGECAHAPEGREQTTEPKGCCNVFFCVVFCGYGAVLAQGPWTQRKFRPGVVKVKVPVGSVVS